jgi:hypothetical protein
MLSLLDRSLALLLGALAFGPLRVAALLALALALRRAGLGLGRSGGCGRLWRRGGLRRLRLLGRRLARDGGRSRRGSRGLLRGGRRGCGLSRRRASTALCEPLLALDLPRLLACLHGGLALGLLLLTLGLQALPALLASALSLLALAQRRRRRLRGCPGGRRRSARRRHRLRRLTTGACGTRRGSGGGPGLGCGRGRRLRGRARLGGHGGGLPARGSTGPWRSRLLVLRPLFRAAATAPERWHRPNRRMRAANGQLRPLPESERSGFRHQRSRCRKSRSTSRRTSRSRISRRRSRCSLPRASASSTFAYGPLK